MLRRYGILIVVILTVLFTAFIYLYPFVLFQKIGTQTISTEIELFKSNDQSTTITTNFEGLDNSYRIRTIRTNKLGQDKHLFEHSFKNNTSLPINYQLISDNSASSQPFIFGIVNDKNIKSIYYDDHVGANGVISFLDERNSFQNSGHSLIIEHPQLFLIKTPFKTGTLFAKDEHDNIIFEQVIER